jgi:DNA-binding MarR family transcriptional regulator
LTKPASLNDNVVYLCSQFSHQFALALSRRFVARGLKVTPEQFTILVALLFKDGVTQKEISETLGRDKTTIARVMSNLKKNGLVKDATDESDNRAKLIYLTSKGRAIQKEAVDISGMLYMETTKGINEAHLQAGVKLLTTMLNKL